MTNRKLISVRVEKDLLKKIDNLCEIEKSINRSHVINNLLCAMLKCCDEDIFWKIVFCYDPFTEGFMIHGHKKVKHDKPNY